MIHQRDQPPLPFLVTLRYESRLLKRARRSRKVHILLPRGKLIVQIPGIVSQTVEQPSRRRATLGKVVRTGGVDFREPEMLVLAGGPAVVDAGELAVGRPDEGRGDAGVVGEGGVEDPAVGRGGELVPFGELTLFLAVGREPEEDVAVGDGEVDDDVALGVFVAACYVAMEC